MIRRLVLAAMAMLIAPATALSTGWSTDLDASRISFQYVLDGKRKQGAFHDFQANGRFSPDALEKAEMTLKVKTRSIDLSNALASAYATSAEWFDSKNHPYVEFHLTGLTSLGGTSYRADGKLMIRGKSKPTSLELNLEFTDGAARARGTLNITRRDFWLGFGPSTALVDVGPDVAVEFDLRAETL